MCKFKILVGDETKASYFLELVVEADVDLTKNKFRKELFSIISGVHQLKSKKYAVDELSIFGDKFNCRVALKSLAFSSFCERNITVNKCSGGFLVSYDTGRSFSFQLVLEVAQEPCAFDITHLMKTVYLSSNLAVHTDTDLAPPALLSVVNKLSYPHLSERRLYIRRI